VRCGASWRPRSSSAGSAGALAPRNLSRRPRHRRKDVNRRNADGSTPLQWAVYDGERRRGEAPLRAGADVSLANNYGATPMSLAAEVGNAEMIAVLLEAGANVDSPNPDGQTALMAVARTGNVKAAQLLLTRARPSTRGRSGVDRPR
jgi:ankyrin repeat protein